MVPPQFSSKSLRAISSRIAELRRVDLRMANVDVLKARLRTVLQGYATGGPVFPPGRIFYRGRIVERAPVFVSEVGAPPPGAIARYGRLNRPEHPVLYTNLEPASVPQEIRAKVGNLVALACFQSVQELNTYSLGFDIDAIFEKGFTRDFPGWCYEDFPALTRKSNRLVSSFIASQMLRSVESEADHEQYKLSVAIAEPFLNADPLDGICYPSIANNGRSDNVAFRVERAESRLRLVRTDLLRIDALTSGTTRFTFLRSSDEFEEDRICWREPNVLAIESPNYSVEPLFMHLESGKWVTRNRENQVVLRES